MFIDFIDPSTDIIYGYSTNMHFLNYCPAASELHQEFPMIKYARIGRSIPHERVFKLDKDNLVREKIF